MCLNLVKSLKSTVFRMFLMIEWIYPVYFKNFGWPEMSWVWKGSSKSEFNWESINVLLIFQQNWIIDNWINEIKSTKSNQRNEINEINETESTKSSKLNQQKWSIKIESSKFQKSKIQSSRQNSIKFKSKIRSKTKLKLIIDNR